MYKSVHAGILYFCQILIKIKYLDRFSKNYQLQNLITICPVKAELFHAEGQTP